MRRNPSISPKIAPSDITPSERYLSRRTVLAAGVGLAALQSAGRLGSAAFAQSPAALADLTFTRNAAFSTAEAPNSYRDISTYNNYSNSAPINPTRRRTRRLCTHGRGMSRSPAKPK
jgi:methionine sulfoxide reductase catalytic subunit